MRKRQNNNPLGSLAVTAAVLLIISLMNTAGSSPVFALLLILLVIAAIAVAVGKRLGKKLKSGEKAKGSIALSMPDSMKLPFYKKEKQSESYTPTRERNEYNEHTLKDSLERDRLQRLKQLKVFLKNGIIDKQEYDKLYARYEKS